MIRADDEEAPQKLGFADEERTPPYFKWECTEYRKMPQKYLTKWSVRGII